MLPCQTEESQPPCYATVAPRAVGQRCLTDSPADKTERIGDKSKSVWPIYLLVAQSMTHHFPEALAHAAAGQRLVMG
jgi:hypothetical protein